MSALYGFVGELYAGAVVRRCVGAVLPYESTVYGAGFANAVSASAIEFRSEGLVTGLGAKMFTIAGSVLVYGSFAATLYGAVLWILHLFGVTLF